MAENHDQWVDVTEKLQNLVEEDENGDDWLCLDGDHNAVLGDPFTGHAKELIIFYQVCSED